MFHLFQWPEIFPGEDEASLVELDDIGQPVLCRAVCPMKMKIAPASTASSCSVFRSRRTRPVR